MQTFPSRSSQNSLTKPDISQLTMTHHILLLQFSMRPIILIEEIANLYLGLSTRTAKNKAKRGELPFPAFRMGDSAKSPFVVHIDDLAAFIDKRSREAEYIWKAYNKF